MILPSSANFKIVKLIMAPGIPLDRMWVYFTFDVSCSAELLSGHQAEFPVVTADTTANLALWQEFFKRPDIQFLLRIFNMVLERLDPDFVKILKTLNEALKNKYGDSLGDNPAYLISLAVHFNQHGSEHTDTKSLHCGWDQFSVGRYLGCKMRFPDLNTEVTFYPTDLMGVRGAGLVHQATDWHDAGRMVLVAFVERRLFGYHHVERPAQFRPFYNDFRSELKSAIPPVPLREAH